MTLFNDAGRTRAIPVSLDLGCRVVNGCTTHSLARAVHSVARFARKGSDTLCRAIWPGIAHGRQGKAFIGDVAAREESVMYARRVRVARRDSAYSKKMDAQVRNSC